MTSSTLPNLVWTGPDRRLSSTVVMPSGTGVAGVYTSLPHAHKVALCASADGKTCDVEHTEGVFLIVHRPSGSTADAMPAVEALDLADPQLVGVQIQGPDPKVVVFPAAGSPRAGAAFTTTYPGTAQVLVTGLEPAVYDVKVGATTICNGVIATTAAEAVYCELPSGAVTVEQVGPLPPATPHAADQTDPTDPPDPADR
jgi:hypothetical protein